MNTWRLWPTMGIVLLLAASGRAETNSPGLQGAEALIARMQALMDAPDPISPAEENPARADYLARRTALLEPDPTRTAEQAAAAWLDLAGDYWVLPPPGARDSVPYRFSGSQSPASFEGLIAAIPPPESWPIIGERLEIVPSDEKPENEARRQILRALMAYLNADPARFESALTALTAGKHTGESDWYRQQESQETIGELKELLGKLGGKAPDPVARQEAKLKAWHSDSNSGEEFTLSGFVVLAGPGKTEDLIRKALTVPGLRLEIEDSDTLRLAQQIALELLPDLPSPQWGLVDGTDTGMDLFQKLSSRFARPLEEDSDADGDDSDIASAPELESNPGLTGEGSRARVSYDYLKAANAYIDGLLRLGRVDDALKLALATYAGEAQSMAVILGDGYGRRSKRQDVARMEFLARWIEASPGIPLWGAYVQAAIAENRASEAIQWLEGIASRPEMTMEQRFQAGLGIAKVHLAMDQTEQAVLQWRNLAQLDARNEMPGVRNQIEALKIEMADSWAGVAFALKNSDWIEEAFALQARARDARAQSNPNDRRRRYSNEGQVFQEALLEQDRVVEAEQRLWSAITNSLTSSSIDGIDDPTAIMKIWVEIYDRANRPADVLSFFEKAPWWGSATNLVQLDADFWVHAAKALHATGRTRDAWPILQQYLALDPGEDKAYAVLIQYPPEQVLPFLDQLYARDRFEERPLIWKATILLRQGKLDEAETTIRLALKIDPTDGEQPPGDRVRSYAVLAEILAAKGKTDDAAFFRNVVKSVRIAEEGDRLAGVGLTTRSLQRYAEAETLFADAYCVQWRLAERLRETGKIAEAQKHYQIAFERMPEQFGQMASLCFGCMGVFDSPDSRGAAETVLTRLAAQPPVRPTVHYLLGQLREAQERYNEAYAEYKKAVELDSNYLDAQEKMYGLRNKINLPPEEWSAIELRLLRMDPLNRHGSVRLEEMGDLKGFWAARTEALPLDFPWVHDLLPLTANQKAQEVAKEDDFREQHFRGYSESKARIVPPGDVIAQHKLVENLNRIQSAWELAQPEADSPFDF